MVDRKHLPEFPQRPHYLSLSLVSSHSVIFFFPPLNFFNLPTLLTIFCFLTYSSFTSSLSFLIFLGFQLPQFSLRQPLPQFSHFPYFSPVSSVSSISTLSFDSLDFLCLLCIIDNNILDYVFQVSNIAYLKFIDIWFLVATLFIFTSLLEFALVNFLSRREGRQGGLARALWIDCQARWVFPLLWACWVTFYFLP